MSRKKYIIIVIIEIWQRIYRIQYIAKYAKYITTQYIILLGHPIDRKKNVLFNSVAFSSK